jgi:alkyl hydroperoxide reductase subunit AhpC
MQSLHAPQGILDALEQISHIVAKPDLTGRDVTEVLTLAKQVQRLFS